MSVFCFFFPTAGTETPTMSRSLISEFIRPLQSLGGDKPELLSVKPTFLSRAAAGVTARAFLSEVGSTASDVCRGRETPGR